MRALCAAASVPYQTVHRWVSQEEANPQMRRFETICEALEAELSRRELAVLAELQKLHPDAMPEAAE